MAVLYNDAGDECYIITIGKTGLKWYGCNGVVVAIERYDVDWCTVRDGQMTDLFLKLQRLCWQINRVEYVV